MDASLRDQVVVITGASGGIGAATAAAFADEGCRLVLHGHRNRQALADLQRRLAVQSVSIGADITREEDVARLFTEAIHAFGRVDVLVVNAGIWIAEPVPVQAMSLEQWQQTLAVDLTGAFLCCRAFLGHLAEQPRETASIVLVGSTAALFGEADHADYAAAKAGLIYGLMPSLKNEIVRLAPRGRVNAVCPGWTRTNMTTGLLEDRDLVRRVTATMALKKLASAEDVARAIVFLASDHLAGHITGAVIPVAGGMEGRLIDTEPP